MKSIKSILIITGLLLLFVGNVGVNVFKHVCQENGVWTSYFVKTADDHCGDKHEAKKAVKSCCSSEKKEQKKGFSKLNTFFWWAVRDSNAGPIG